MLPLIIGSLLAVLSLAYVLVPLLRGATPAIAPDDVPDLPPEASALEALREIEFDEATGKLSPEDYATLKATYTPMARAELRAREDAAAADAAAADAAAAGSAGDDPAEALIARMKARGLTCPACGPRPESDALFCSDCGRFLGGACGSCGAPAGSDTARFCVECGASLAA